MKNLKLEEGDIYYLATALKNHLKYVEELSFISPRKIGWQLQDIEKIKNILERVNELRGK